MAVTAIPDELDTLAAAPLLCAGRTVYTALRSSGVKAGETVAVHGIGGLGHLAVQYARKLGYRTVAISRGKAKRELALKLGTHVYIDAEEVNPAEELNKLGGAKAIIATVPSGKAIAGLINGLGYEGQIIIVAAPGDPIPVNAGQLFQGRRSIKGWTARYSHDSADSALHFSLISGVLPMIEVFPLEQAAEAYEKMMTSKVHFRSVLKIGE